MIDDLTRARQHLNEASKSPAGSASEANALIGIGLTLLHMAEQQDLANAPLRMVVHDSPPTASRTEAETARAGRLDFEADQSARRAQERWDRDAIMRRVAAASPPVVLDGGVNVHPGDPGMPGYNPKHDSAVWRPDEQVGPTPGAGGVFGQMEERPNDLENPDQH